MNWCSRSLCVVGVACTSGEEVETGIQTVVDTGTAPYVIDSQDDQVLRYDEADLQAAVEEGLARIIQLDATPVLDAYQAMLGDTEESCPDWINSNGYLTWLGGCTTTQGTQYEGQGLIILDDEVYFDEGLPWQQRGIYLVGEVTNAEGDALVGTGTINHYRQETDSYSMTYQAIAEGTTLTGDWATGHWESGVGSPELGRSSVYYHWEDATAVALFGRIALDGDTVDMLAIEDFVFIDDAVSWGSHCDLEPSGTLSIRTIDGVWLDMSFEGSSWSDKADLAQCDGCAEAWANGQAIGELCFDFAPLLDLVVP